MIDKRINATICMAVCMACSGNRNQAGISAPQMIEGELRVAGSEPMPMVMLQPQSGGDEIRLHGPLLEELRRLGGIVVEVTGNMSESAVHGFDVTGYEITSVEGRRPLVGTVTSRDGDLWLDSDESVRLIEVPAGLRSRVGAKVWVLGTMVNGALQPETYGVISEP